MPLAGCKSIGFEKPSLPSLAFWKKNSDDELPPPPARHFDPSRFESEGDNSTQVATKKDSFDKYGLKTKADDLEMAAAKKFGAARNSIASKSDSGSAPRQPYRMEDFSPDLSDSIAKKKNSFDLDASKLKSKFDSASGAVKSDLSDAQQKFRSAMNSSLQNGNELAKESKAAAISNDNNSFAAKPVSKSSAQGFRGFDAGSLNSSFNSATKSLAGEKDAFAAKANSSLYDINGKLRNAAADLKKQTNNAIQSPINSNLKSEFEKRLAAANSAAASGNGKVNGQLQALANVSQQTRQAIEKPFPKLVSQPNQEQGFTPSGNGSSFQLAKPDQIAGTKNLARDTVNTMRSEVEEARRQIELLKQQVAAAKNSAANQAKQAAAQANQSLDASVSRLLNQASNASNAFKNTIEGVVLPLDNSTNRTSVDDNARVATRNGQFGIESGNSFSTVRPKDKPSGNQSLVPQRNSNSSGGSFYPSTPFGGFGANQKKQTQPEQVANRSNQFESFTPSANQSNIGKVGFNDSGSSGSVARQAVADVPVESDFGGIHRANQIDTNVPDVRIPASLLTGSSSFAPGSTTPLKQ